MPEVGEVVVTRRAELGRNRAEAARAAGVAERTLAALEAGIRWPREATRARIEMALGWEVGSLATVREGGRPVTSPSRWRGSRGKGTRVVAAAEIREETERAEIDALAGRLDQLSARGLMATSQYVAILLDTDPSEGFRRGAKEIPWSARAAAMGADAR